MLKIFKLEERGSNVGREARAGLATFLTMAYILVVNAQILSSTGMPAEDVTTATAVAAALACLVMGLWANLPFALAPGMGLNAYFALPWSAPWAFLGPRRWLPSSWKVCSS